MQIDWKNWFDQGLPYDEFVNKYGNDNERSRWQSVYERIRLAPEQEELLKSFVREMNVLVLAATWCGDCVNQGPIYRRFEEANDRIQVRFLERDEVPELRDALKINGGARIPVVVFLSEDFFECARLGERPLSMYRQLAYSQLESGRPTDIAGSGDELLARATAEWLNEFERIHWMLRLSPRLRKVHGD
ncbi:MAG: thioredoxin family protein [Limnochordales bacterium]